MLHKIVFLLTGGQMLKINHYKCYSLLKRQFIFQEKDRKPG